MSWREDRTDRNERWDADRGKPGRKSPFWDMRKYSPEPRRETNHRDRFDRKDRPEFDRHKEDNRRDDRNESRREDREHYRRDRTDFRRDDRSDSRREDRDSSRRENRVDHRRNDRDREHYRREHRSRERSQDRSRSRSTASKRRSPIDTENVPNAPSPPRISRRSRSNSVDAQESITVTMEDADSVTDFEPKLDDINLKYQSEMSPGDWMCKCGSYNFRRRQLCFRRGCGGHKSEGTLCGPEALEGKTGITKKILFRKLDALTTEEKVIEELKERCSKSVLESIAGITIGREALTGVSKCLAYITFNSIIDSTAAYAELTHLNPPLVIDSRTVLISYYQEPVKHTNTTTDYSYYPPTFISTSAMSETDKVNAAAAVAQSAISAAQNRQSWTKNLPTVPISSPTGDGKTVYSPPDVTSFLYEESSGYYYDPATALYFDANTQYFYNSTTSQYLFWDATTNTYKKAVTTDKAATPQQPEEKKKKDTKEDKVKVAKKIAKDMERWAKTLNQKKENAKANYVAEQPVDTGKSKGSADIGFSVLGAGPSIIAHEKVVRERELSPPLAAEEFLTKNSPQTAIDSDENVIDWAKLTCLLCKRKFPSAEVLTKHKLMSDLHKQNLAEFRQKTDLNQLNNGYRDRAAERRMKFGEDEPILNKRYEPPEPLPPPVLFQPGPSVVDTIGGKMLQKMGWSQGKGLGKEEQGRIAPIEAEQRPGLAGLGQKRGIYTPTPGETYRDTVKKLMIARYKEVVGQEDGK